MARLLLEIVTSAIAPPPGELLQLVPLLSRHFVFRRVLTQVSRPRPVLQSTPWPSRPKRRNELLLLFFAKKKTPALASQASKSIGVPTPRPPAQLVMTVARAEARER